MRYGHHDPPTTKREPMELLHDPQRSSILSKVFFNGPQGYLSISQFKSRQCTSSSPRLNATQKNQITNEEGRGGGRGTPRFDRSLNTCPRAVATRIFLDVMPCWVRVIPRPVTGSGKMKVFCSTIGTPDSNDENSSFHSGCVRRHQEQRKTV